MQNSIAIKSDGKPIAYAWPGGYPVYYLIQEFEKPYGTIDCFCPDCTPRFLGGNDVVISAEVNWEDPQLYCDSCQKRIESAYAED